MIPLLKPVLFQAQLTNPGNVIQIVVYNQAEVSIRLRESAMFVGNVTMEDHDSEPRLNTLCMSQPSDADAYPWIYDCAQPIYGEYVILYKSQQYAVCETYNCFDVREMYIYMAE